MSRPQSAPAEHIDPDAPIPYSLTALGSAAAEIADIEAELGL